MKPTNCFFILLVLLSAGSFAKSSYTVFNNALVLPTTIQFDLHAYDVKDTLDPMLDIVADYLKENPSITKLRIEGHVYTEKTPEANIKLSLQRAAMVSYYLTTKGVDCSRLIPVAFGDTKPIAPTDECNVLTNTRIDFVNAEMFNKAVPGNAVDGFAPKVFNPCDN